MSKQNWLGRLFGRKLTEEPQPPSPAPPPEPQATMFEHEPPASAPEQTVFEDEPTLRHGATILDASALAPEGAAASTSAVDDVPAVWQVGDVILDLYAVKDVHAGGGMGLVYCVHHQGWNVDLALKSPRAQFFQTEAQKQSFERECETWVNLGLHPHIVSCYYVRRIGGTPCVFAEYVAGGSLTDQIEDGTLYHGGSAAALARILDIVIQFAWGLDYAHTQGLVHQDVKPANVMLAPDGTAKVSDFGLAQACLVAEAVAAPGGAGQSVVVPGVGLMTLEYRSPEQAAGAPLTRKTDIWSWGVSVLELFTGGRTWLVGEAAPETLEGYLAEGSPDASIPAMPAMLANLLRQCFQEDPADRPASMAEVAAALQQIYAQEVGQLYPRAAPKPAEALADSLNNRALSLLDLGKTEEAERLWGEALQADPHHPEATYNWGVLRWQRGAITDEVLVQQLEAVRTSHGGDWVDEYMLALVHLERGDVEAAIPLLEAAVQQAPGETEVQAALQMARSGTIASNRSLSIFRGHNSDVASVCLSCDGCLALSGGFDHTLRLWEVATGTCLGTFYGHTDRVVSACFSGDSRLALSGSLDKTLRLWEVATGQCLRTFEGHTEGVHSVCLSEDGRFALSGSSDKTLRLWEVATGHCLRIFQVHTLVVTSVYLSPNGRWALSGSWANTLQLWDTATGECSRTFEGHMGWVQSVSLSADGRFALSGSKDMTVRLWDLASGQCLRTFVGHSQEVTSVSLSADGHFALSGSHDQTLRLWDVAAGQCVRTFRGHSQEVTSVSLSADGYLALSGSHDCTVRLWKVPPNNTAICSPHLSRLWSHAELSHVETQANNLLKRGMESFEESRFAEALALVRTIRELPGYERAPSALEAWRKLSLICVRVGLRTGWLEKTFEGHTNHVISVCFSADGHFALTGGADATLRLWDVTTGKSIRIIEGYRTITGQLMRVEGLAAVCLSADGHLALSADMERSLLLWDVTTGQCLRTFDEPTGSVRSVWLSADGRLALVGCTEYYNDHSVQLYEVATGKCLRTFGQHEVWVYDVHWSVDGRLALSGSADQTLRLWEISTGKCLVSCEGHTDAVTSVRLSVDGNVALSGSKDKTLRLWDVLTGKCLRSFHGHTGEVNVVCLSTDGRFALSGSADKTLRLWKTSTGECLRIFEGHTSQVDAVCLSADGRWALSGGGGFTDNDGAVRLWELDWELEARDSADWDEGARPYLETFLTLHTPYAAPLPTDRDPTDEEVTLALTRCGTPTWTEEDFQDLIRQLQNAGYGWLRPAGVRAELGRMARDWQRPPPLPRV